ncbi:MAG: PAS domain S-box protein [Alphaproteobacteria bacterium]|nr:PAS domain S-box protein [Alphaproteobacteria bacterium]
MALDDPRAPLRAYGIAAGAVALTVAVRWSLEPWLDHRAPYLLFVLPVLAAASFRGVGPSLCAAFLGLIAGGAFGGGGLTEPHALAEAAIYLMIAGGIILCGREVDRLRARSSVNTKPSSDPTPQMSSLAAQLNLLIDSAAEYAIYMIDPDGRVLTWNRGAERLKGWAEAEIVGRDVAVFYPKDARQAGRLRASLTRAANEGKVEEEDWLLRKDGSEFLAHVSTTALHDDTGALIGFSKVLRDITDQRAAEKALEASANHLRSILSTVPDAMIVINERGAILSFSAAAERLFGCAEGDLLGKNVSCLMPSPDRQQHDGYIERYLTTGERKVIGLGRVVVGQRRDGTTFPMELSVGEASGFGPRVFTGFVRDLTERQRTQARVEELQAELIHIARVSGMGAMASTLAHELNQPITAVANYVEAVRDLLAHPDPDDFPMIREALGDAAGQALRAGHIVRRLRAFVARGEVEKTVEALAPVLHEAAAMGLMGPRDGGLEVVFELDPAVDRVLIDKVQIQQVVINLARNGFEAMAGGARPTVWIRSAADGPASVRVTVADNGPGVAPDLADRLFTAFVSTKADGMGLGLSICRTIVEANGGRLWYSPRPGGGAEFHFTLVKADMEQADGR